MQTSKVIDRKYAAGASNTVNRTSCKVATKPPFPFKANLEIASFKAKKETLIFLPDKLFIMQKSKIGALNYSDIISSSHTTRFIESEGVPKDSQVVGQTWKYVNKSGGPDRRFKDNRQFPVCLYGELELSSTSGLNTVIMYSNPSISVKGQNKLPKAKAFKRWVTHEVIPSIRKAGAYMTDSLLDRVKNDPEIIYSLAEELLNARNKVKGLETELSVAKPKAEFQYTFVNPNDCTGLRVTAKELNVPERKFINFLIDEKFLYRSPAQQLLPYKKPSNEGLFIVPSNCDLNDFVYVIQHGLSGLFRLFKNYCVS